MFIDLSHLHKDLGSMVGAIVLCGLGLVGVAIASNARGASVFGSNLIINGNAEAAAGSTTGGPVPSIPGWDAHGTPFTVVEYGVPGFLALTDPGPKERGKNFFAGGDATATSDATQSIDVSSGALAIDTGKTQFLLSGWLGGYSDQEDNAVLTIDFYDESDTKVGSAVLGPVTAADRHDASGLVYKDKSATLPAGTRRLGVSLVMTRASGSYDDGYADDLGIVLTAPPPAPTKTSLTTSEKEVSAGGAVTLTALVMPSSGTTTPSGTVTFKTGSTVLGTVTLNGTGQATLKTSSLPVGTDALTATYNASLIFSASTSATITVTVTAAGGVTLTPASISFPPTAIGAASAIQRVTLENTGKVSVSIGSVTLAGGQADDFTVASACGKSLAVGASCTIGVAFKPVSSGAKSAKLSVTDDTADSPQSVALSAIGVPASSTAVVNLSATSLAFGSEKVDATSASKSVTVTNSGTATLMLTSVTVSGGQADDFILTTSCGSSLAAGASCTLSVKFKPVSTGAKSSSVRLVDTAGGSPQSVQLSGSGS